MADVNLRRRLGAAAAMALDEELLDVIHNRLIASDGKGKIPVTLKFEFEVGDTGELEVSMKASANLGLTGFSIRLTSDGKQLKLFEESVSTKEGVEAPQDRPSEAIAPREEKGEAPKHESPRATQVASDRVAQIRAQNEQLYRSGHITRSQAKMAGVDVDRLDAAVS